MLTLRRRIAAAYDRSAWVRLATIASLLVVNWLGFALILLLAPMGTQPLLWLGWMLVLAVFFAWLVVGPRPEMP